ncbi:MAG: redoxin domain-containing protein [Opitutales bacterium]|jgi:hypothetical protein
MSGKRILAVLMVVLSAVTSMDGADEVSAFLDAYSKAVVAHVSITQRVACRIYVGTEVLPVRITGLCTWGAGTSPFLYLTAQKQADELSGQTRSTFAVACREDELRLVDGQSGVYYEEKLSHTGTNLLASRLDIAFAILMYPAILDSYRSSPGTVSDVQEDGIAARKLVADDGICRLELVVEASSFLPLRIERTLLNPGGQGIRYVCELSVPKVSAYLPPDEMFQIDRTFGYPRKRYDPVGLFSIPDAPTFSVKMLDGSTFSLADQKGKWVLLSFHSESERIRPAPAIYVERAGDKARAAGAVFIDVYPQQTGEAPVKADAYHPANTCVSEVLMRMYGVNSSGLPCIIIISPQGRVTDMLVGYIPGLTERAIEQMLKSLPPDGGAAVATP